MNDFDQAIVEIVRRALGDATHDAGKDPVGKLAEHNEDGRNDHRLEIYIGSDQFSKLLDSLYKIVQSELPC